MPVDELAPVLEVVLDAIQEAIFVDYLRVRVVWVGGGFAYVVFLDDVVDGEVVQAGFAGEFFGGGSFADLDESLLECLLRCHWRESFLLRACRF